MPSGLSRIFHNWKTDYQFYCFVPRNLLFRTKENAEKVIVVQKKNKESGGQHSLLLQLLGYDRRQVSTSTVPPAAGNPTPTENSNAPEVHWPQAMKRKVIETLLRLRRIEKRPSAVGEGGSRITMDCLPGGGKGESEREKDDRSHIF